MSLFNQNSAFHDSYARNVSRQMAFPPLEEAPLTRISSESPPIEHWHHDLETIDILLDQDDPDVDRARRMIDEIRREMYVRI